MSTIKSVTKIKLKEPIPVYDIEVPGNSNFVLEDGSVVHNSKDIADAIAGSHADAMKYKDEFIFFHPDHYDYEGLNDTTSQEDKYKEELRQSLVASAAKKPEAIAVPKKIDPEDIFSTIQGNNNYLDNDILFL